MYALFHYRQSAGAEELIIAFQYGFFKAGNSAQILAPEAFVCAHSVYIICTAVILMGKEKVHDGLVIFYEVVAAVSVTDQAVGCELRPMVKCGIEGKACGKTHRKRTILPLAAITLYSS